MAVLSTSFPAFSCLTSIKEKFCHRKVVLHWICQINIVNRTVSQFIMEFIQ